MGYEKITNPANYHMASFGQFGLRFIQVGQLLPEGEKYRVIQALEATTISFSNEAGGDATIVSLAIPAGFTLYGIFNGVSLSAGSVIAYIA